jgi:hypothetical protein
VPRLSRTRPDVGQGGLMPAAPRVLHVLEPGDDPRLTFDDFIATQKVD